MLTDAAGRRHGSTVPAGLVRADVWRRHLAAALPRMAAPFAEVLSATERPFVTRVCDAFPCGRRGDDHDDAAAAVVAPCDGRVVLVGDALATFRPHFAVATEQAARHCLGLAGVWAGETSLDQWAAGALTYAKRMWLAGRVLGAFGLGRWWEFVKFLCAYVVFLARLKLGRR